MYTGDKNIFTQQMLGEKSTQAARNALADIQVCCRVLQHRVVCCSALQCVAAKVHASCAQCAHGYLHVLQRVAEWCSVLQSVAV